jgi:hypothetical protein
MIADCGDGSMMELVSDTVIVTADMCEYNHMTYALAIY